MKDWKSIATNKRVQQASSIPKAWRLSPDSIPSSATNFSAMSYIESHNLLTPLEETITSYTNAGQLASHIAARRFTSLEVTEAFCKRAAILQQLTGCCTEMMFERAINRAKWLDMELEKTGKVVGPLHGVPFSFKDVFEVEGVDCTVGWVGKVGKPSKQDGLEVELLLRLGAVVYVKTNIPQSMMMSDSYNHVFGQSINSLNSGLISGGSSGGEGALIGAHGSILGLGTDIGGSVRIPAVFQGLYGMSPSVGRSPNIRSTWTQSYIVPAVSGPMASSLESIELFFEALCNSEPWNIDPGLLPIPWRTNIATPPSRPLKLGFIFDDGITKCQPPIERITRELAAKLKDAGHEVFEWETKDHQEGYDLWLKAVLADGGNGARGLCGLIGEPLIKGMLVGTEETFLQPAERISLDEAKQAYKKAYLKRWTDSGIDALIMPVTPFVGFPPKTWVKSGTIVSYTSQWNFVDYAALTIPVGKVDAALDRPKEDWLSYKARSPSDEFNHEQYDVDLVKNMPVGVQVVGGRFGEEKCVAVAKVVRKLLA